MYSKEQREKLARLAVELRAIVSTAKNDGNRGLTSAEQEKFNKLEADYTALEAGIKANESIDRIENDLRSVDPDRIAATMGGEVYGAEAEKENKRKHNEAFSLYLRQGVDGLSAEQKTLMRTKFRAVQPGEVRNAQTLTTTGGGYLIPTGFSDALEEALKWFGGILGNVGEFQTESGNPLPWPTVNDTTNKGRILGVNTQVTETDLTFGQVTFNAYIFTSDSVLVPLALIEDSYFNLDTFIAKALGTRLGRLLNNRLTVGSGTNEPDGIQTAVIAAGNTTQGATGETTSLIYNDLVDTMHLVDPAYRQLPSAKWMFHDSTLKALRLLKDTAGRPLWQPGLTAGFGSGFPETILDKPYVINNDMPVMAANAYPILFGDMSSYKVRRVASGTTVLRLVERYADYLQVGYIGFLRADGQLLDAGTHPIAAFQNSAT
ncbi:MAG TPA: phage major capsid protein [Acidobacteriaceae bacterium]|nr:phage major capsid protein [Acidobacteriaceae bacterium]